MKLGGWRSRSDVRYPFDSCQILGRNETTLSAIRDQAHRSMISTKRKTANAAVSPKSIKCFDQAVAAAFRFLRQPRRPNAPSPEANSGNVAGSGVVAVGAKS
jgi:hypothetical protein